MKATSIAVLMTCYNRKNTTLACLDRLMSQEAIDDVSLQVYLVNDRCTDGTGKSVRSRYPHIKMLKGDGKLFWCGGMRLAFAEALKDDFEYYLWLNDDSLLFPYAIRTMLNAFLTIKRKLGQDIIAVGSLKDAQSEVFTYGGYKKHKFWRPMSFLQVEPSDKSEPCDVFNGNCVLIPRNIAKVTGNLSADFTHGIGDYDYGLRAKEDGFSCFISPGYVGTCSRNTFKGSYKDKALSVKERIDKLSRPTGLPPSREWMLFIKRYGGVLWPIYWLRTLVRIIFPWLWVLLRSKRLDN